jgi:hypothetical protein
VVARGDEDATSAWEHERDFARRPHGIGVPVKRREEQVWAALDAAHFALVGLERPSHFALCLAQAFAHGAERDALGSLARPGGAFGFRFSPLPRCVAHDR